MVANYLIGLREGLEAALVVGILVAYLVRADRREALRPLWIGVVAAVLVSLIAGALLTFTSRSMSFKAQEMFGGLMSVGAVCFVTWMIFWMRRTARSLKGDLQGRVGSALAIGSGALALTAFIAVGREGLETALFIWTAVQATDSTFSPVLGATLGLITATALGYLVYRGSVHLDLGRFFTYTGAALVVVAAGVLAYGMHDLQEAGVLGGLHDVAFNAERILPPSSWYGSLFKGMFSISAKPSWVELGVWFAYLVPTMYLFLRPPRPEQSVAGASASATPIGASR